MVLPAVEHANGSLKWCFAAERGAGGRFELAMEPTAIGLVSLNSNSETHMTAICDARLIYGGGFHGCMLCNFNDIVAVNGE